MSQELNYLSQQVALGRGSRGRAGLDDQAVALPPFGFAQAVDPVAKARALALDARPLVEEAVDRGQVGDEGLDPGE